MQLQDSLTWADRAYFGSAVIAAIFGALAIIAGFAQNHLNGRIAAEKDRAFEGFRIASASEVAGLNRAAAEARLETEKIKDLVAWRTLPPDAAAALRAALAQAPGSVNLRYTDGDPEALFLASQIADILAAAQWKIAAGSLKLNNALVFGTFLPDADGADARALRNAFTAAGVPFETGPLPPGGVGFSVSTIAAAPVLMIGSKPRPMP